VTSVTDRDVKILIDKLKSRWCSKLTSGNLSKIHSGAANDKTEVHATPMNSGATNTRELLAELTDDFCQNAGFSQLGQLETEQGTETIKNPHRVECRLVLNTVLSVYHRGRISFYSAANDSDVGAPAAAQHSALTGCGCMTKIDEREKEVS